jgi:hypothetical protein
MKTHSVKSEPKVFEAVFWGDSILFKSQSVYEAKAEFELTTGYSADLAQWSESSEQTLKSRDGSQSQL